MHQEFRLFTSTPCQVSSDLRREWKKQGVAGRDFQLICLRCDISGLPFFFLLSVMLIF